MNITIKDPLGNLISKAEVAVTSKTKETTKIKETNAEGIADFDKVPDGEYLISVFADGFVQYKSDVILIKANETKRIQITLEILPIEENVSVENSEEEKRNSYGGIKTFSQEEIERLPDDPEQFEKALQRIAGESVSGGSLPITVNGLEDSKLPSKEEIKSITVYREIFSAQFEGTSGERIEIQTKSTRAKFGGSISSKFGDSFLNAKDPFLGEKSPLHNKESYIILNGSITDKVSWSAYTEFSNIDIGSAINATKLDSALKPVSYKTFQSVPRRYRGGSLTLDANPTEKAKLNLRYSYQTTTNKNLGVGGFILPSRGYQTTNQTHGLRFNTIYIINPSVFNAAKGSITFGHNQTTSLGNQIGVNVLDSFFDGSLGTTRQNHNFRAEIYDDVSITLKKVRIGIGFMLRNNQNRENSDLLSGVYTFNGRTAPVLDTNNNSVNDSQGNIEAEFISSLESYRRTLLFSQMGFSASQIRNLGGGASQLSISSGNSSISVNQTDYAGYLQLAFPLSETIAASFGVRYENQTNIKSNLDFSPRFGLIWSPKSNKKIHPIFSLPKISTGFGWFYSRFGIENTFSSRRTTHSTLNNYSITASSLLDSFPNLPTLQNIQQSSIGRSTLTIDENFKTPFQTIFNFSLDKNLSKILSMNFRYSSINSFRQSVTRNINAPIPNSYNELNPNNAIYPFGNRQAIFKLLSKGKSATDRLQVSLYANGIPLLKQKFSFGLGYSFNKGRSNIVAGNSNYLDAYDFSDEYAPTVLDGVHNFSTWFDTYLPRSINLYVGGTFRSGLRYNFITGKDSNGDGYFDERPAFASNLNKQGIISTEYGVFDPNPTLGDTIIPRNFGRGPGFFELNLILTKTFKLFVDEKTKKAKYSLRLNINVNNVLNTNNMGNPIGNLSSPNFLRSLYGNSIDGGGRISEPRTISFNTAFSF